MQKNSKLGWALHEHLVSKGLETPMIINSVSNPAQEKIAEIEGLMAQMMDTIGLDRADDSLEETPHRIAKMYINEFFAGLDYDNFPKCTTVANKFHQNVKEDEVRPFVLVKNIKVNSFCEHHFLGILGNAHIAYIPGENVLGLSKLARVVEFFSRRPQVQERLCEQIAEAMVFTSGCKDVAVYMDCEHLCMTTRGIEEPCAATATLATRGGFAKKESSLRTEFLSLVASFERG